MRCTRVSTILAKLDSNRDRSFNGYSATSFYVKNISKCLLSRDGQWDNTSDTDLHKKESFMYKNYAYIKEQIYPNASMPIDGGTAGSC